MQTWAEWEYRFFDALEFLGARKAFGQHSRHVVVYAPGHFGDFLQLTPMLRSLREKLPRDKITWLIGGWNMELARRYAEWADDIVEFSPRKDTLLRGEKRWMQSVARQWRCLRDLRAEGIDLLLNPMPEDPIARFVSNTLRPRLWVGVGDRRPPRVRDDIETIMVPFEKNRPEAEAQLALLARAGLPAGENDTSESSPVFTVTDGERAWAATFLEEEAIADRPLALLAPGSGWSGKNWPAERFAELAGRLQLRGLEVVWTGGASEKNLCRGPGRNWMGKLTLWQLAAVMERAAVWIGNDCGPMHLTVAVGCRTVSFWGPTNEHKWGGLGAKHVKLRGMGPCPGCIYWDWRRECPKTGHPCMTAIGVDEAERKALEMLAAKES